MLLCISFSLLSVAVSAIERPWFNISGSSGVPAMHAAVLNTGDVVLLDKVEFWTQLHLPNGRWAYSSIYNPITNAIKPLAVSSNPFCCGGTFLPDGRLVSLGGNAHLSWFDPTVGDGFDAIRYLDGDGSQDAWSEPGNKLASKRWYASAQTMADGTTFVAAGSVNGLTQTNFVNNNPTYEVLDPKGISNGQNVQMDILINNQPWFMYPFLHLMKDGTLFVFTSRASQIFDVSRNKVVKQLPDLQGMHRTYPNTGGSVMLPLSKSNNWEPEVMVCGGGGQASTGGQTDATCGRIQPLADNATWSMSTMPQSRTMVEGVLLLDGKVLWINGAQTGTQGFGAADDPAYEALIYDPQRHSWTSGGTSTIPRLYHSVALLLKDGTVLVTGSNPNEMPLAPDHTDPSNLTTKYPTEFRCEHWTPPYLQGDKTGSRPQNVTLSTTSLKPGNWFTVAFRPAKPLDKIDIVMYRGGFVTHAVHMGQVMYHCENKAWVLHSDGSVTVQVNVPDVKLSPGPYFIYVMANSVPSVGVAVMVEMYQ